MGIQDIFYLVFYLRMFNLTEHSAQQLTEAHLRAAAATLEEADTWVQLDQNLKYVLIQRHTRSRSHSLQTTSAWDWTRDTQTVTQQVCPANWNKEYRVSHKVAEANFRHQQLWGIIFPLGIWAQQVWTWQQHPTTRRSQDSSPVEWNKRSTSTTPAAECRHNTHLHRSQNNNSGVLQDYNGLQQISPSSIVKCGNELQWKSCTDGHRSHQQWSQRKERTQRKRQRKQGLKRQERIQRKRLRATRQRKRIHWTAGNTLQRILPGQQRKMTRKGNGQWQRKGTNNRVLRVWPTRSHCTWLQSLNSQPTRGWQQVPTRHHISVVQSVHLWQPLVDRWPDTGQRNPATISATTVGTSTTTAIRCITSTSTQHSSSKGLKQQQQQTTNIWCTGIRINRSISTEMSWWMTVEQQHMYAQYGLQQQHPFMTFNHTRHQTWEQQQKTRSMSMDTSGSTWPTTTNSRLSFPSTCAQSHNPFCQSHVWQNKASRCTWVNNRQSLTQLALKQSSQQRKAPTSFWWTPGDYQATTNSTSTRQMKASKQPFHQSHSHQPEKHG